MAVEDGAMETVFAAVSLPVLMEGEIRCAIEGACVFTFFFSVDWFA